MTTHEGLDLLLTDYEVTGRRTLRTTRIRVRQLKRLVPNIPFAELTTAHVLEFARRRLTEPNLPRKTTCTPSTVNRELAILRRACTLAEDIWKPRVRHLKEAAPRKGFFTPEELAAVCGHLQGDVADAVRFAYLTGWRRGEVFMLRWDEVDFDRAEVHLLAGATKNGEARTFPLYPQLRALLEARAECKDGPYVFHRNGGRPFTSIYSAWRSACKKAGVPGRLLHDFRRTAARNLIDAGVDQQTAQRLLGHKTASIFQRYRIVDDRGLRAAAEKLGLALG